MALEGRPRRGPARPIGLLLGLVHPLARPQQTSTPRSLTLGTTGAPDPARTAAVIAHCREHGKVLLMNAGTWGNVIRFMPPLVVTEDEMAEALAAVSAAVAATG